MYDITFERNNFWNIMRKSCLNLNLIKINQISFFLQIFRCLVEKK